MSGAADERLRLAEDLAFFGRVTASTTHQINNVLAIVAELNGLLEDLGRMAAEGRPIPPGKLDDVLARSQRQVERGVDYLDRLNAFAHAVDSPEATVDLGEAVAGVTALAGRVAQLRRATLTFTASEAARVRTRPFRLLRAVHLGIEAALAGGGRGRDVAVAVRPAADGGGVVEIVSSEALAAGAETARLLAAMGELAAELGGGLAVEAAPVARIALSLP